MRKRIQTKAISESAMQGEYFALSASSRKYGGGMRSTSGRMSQVMKIVACCRGLITRRGISPFAEREESGVRTRGFGASRRRGQGRLGLDDDFEEMECVEV